MANASAKKALAAKARAGDFYRTLLLILNMVYCCARVSTPQWTVWSLLWPFLFLFLPLQLYCYLGILEDCDNHTKKVKKMDASTSTSEVEKKDALTGGVHLDVLGIVLLAQFGSLYTKWGFGLLLLLPLWGAYSLYQTFYGGVTNTNNHNDTTIAQPSQHAQQERRRKRAEQRRQKR